MFRVEFRGMADVYFFFFKQKTAYEMRISDWSSDVCSSDLFFTAELMDAMRIAAAGDIAPDRMEGSWAGAMGQPQFMPSTFQRHAIDADGDGRRDIWPSLADVFGSAGNFLNAAGWRAGEDWGQEVILPQGFDYAQADLTVRRPVSAWQAMGVRSAEGRPLDGSVAEASRSAE